MTFEDFQKIPAGEIFRVVTTKYHTIERINNEWPELTFVCVKGKSIEMQDWAIYCHFSIHNPEYIKWHGNKVGTDANILSIFPCDAKTLKYYRR